MIKWKADLYKSDPVIRGLLFLGPKGDESSALCTGVVDFTPKYSISHKFEQGSGVEGVLSTIGEHIADIGGTIDQWVRKHVSDFTGGTDISMGWSSMIHKEDIGTLYPEYKGTDYTTEVPDLEVILLPEDDGRDKKISNTPLDQLSKILGVTKEFDNNAKEDGSKISNAEVGKVSIGADEQKSALAQFVSSNSLLQSSGVLGAQDVMINVVVTKAPHGYERYIHHSPWKLMPNGTIQGTCTLVVGGITDQHVYPNLLIENIEVEYSRSRLYEGTGSGATDKGPAWITLKFKFKAVPEGMWRTLLKYMELKK